MEFENSSINTASFLMSEPPESKHQIFVKKELPQELCNVFFEIMQSQKNQLEIFNTLMNIIQLCDDNLENIFQLKNKTTNEITKKLFIQHLNWLEKERNVWRLISCLYTDRLLIEDEKDDIEDNNFDLTRTFHLLSEKQCVESLYKNNALIRHLQIVVDWLEKICADQKEKNFAKSSVQFFTDKSIGWENTLLELEDNKSIAFASKDGTCKHLDPDAPLRENKKLHSLDQEDNNRLCYQIFYKIRCGKLEEAQDLCIHCGQSWRAALLDGWRLYHDPNYYLDTNIENNKKEIQKSDGNVKRDLWKKCAWKLTSINNDDKYWRASLSVFCGNLNALLQVCDSWEDLLWAYLKIMIDIRVETEIREQVIMRRYEELPDDYWQNKMSLQDVFDKLATFEQTECSVKSTSFPDFVTQLYAIQRFIILDKPNELIDYLQEHLNIVVEQFNRFDHPLFKHYLRFLAHLVLVLRDLGQFLNKNTGEYIIDKYIEYLIEMNEHDLVAFYACQLSRDNQIKRYSQLLIKITNDLIQNNSNQFDHIENEFDQIRQSLLGNGQKFGLDIETITKNVVVSILRTDQTIASSSLVTDNHLMVEEISDSDKCKILSIGWLLFFDTQIYDAIYYTNELFRYFLTNGKLEAMKKAYNNITQQTDIIHQLLLKVEMTSKNADESILEHIQQVDKKIQNLVGEFLCLKMYLNANESFNEWFVHFHHNRPKAPQPLLANKLSEKVIQEHRESQYKAELERWKLKMEHRTKETKMFLYNILTFPNGWLSTDGIEQGNNNEPDCKRRITQMIALRKLYIPKIFLLLHTILHETGNYEECISLAELVTDENKKLYLNFTKQKLGELLNKINSSVLASIEAGKGAFGC